VLLTGGAAFGQGGAAVRESQVALAPAGKDLAAPSSGGGASQQQPAKPAVLLLRGLDKLTGRAIDIVAPIGQPVHFATLTITARYCYSTPPSETPETAAFVQIEDHRPDQPARRIFSGWMYASSPGLNALQHPLYDVWVIDCRGSNAPQSVASSTAGPAQVQSPDASDDEKIEDLPPDASR
jgi:hypothetical protein